MLIVRTKMRPTRTAKHFEEGVIWSFIKQHFETESSNKKQAVTKASLQNRNGTEACARSVKPVSTM